MQTFDYTHSNVQPLIITRVMRWNAVILLAPNQSINDIVRMLESVDGYEDIVLQEGTYTFSCQSLESKKCVAHGTNKLYFKVGGEILYVMWYPKELGRRPN